MVDTLRCDEIFNSPNSRMSTPIRLRERDYQALLPAFCNAYEDPAILGDARVLANMLWVERAYVPAPPALCYGRDGTQDEIKPHMRRIVVEWMLDVCVDQRCNVDVFLLATNIIDRFLSTIRLRKKQFQLLGAAAIFLASKLIEPSPVSALTLVKYTADTYDREELLSMELLILSKLKWDLTAVTAYDYLDHLLEALHRNSGEEGDTDSRLLESSHLESLRKQSERLITLCATDPTFTTLPASMVASASLASAVQQDYESGQPPTSGPSVRINEIFNKIREFTRVEMDHLRQCIDQIEELFISGSRMDHETTSVTSSPSKASTASADSGLLLSSPEAQSRPSPTKKSAGNSNEDEKQRTPTEVFRVSALCVT